VNGKSSLKEIAQILGYDGLRVWGMLERLVEAGFVRIEERAPKAPRRRRSGSRAASWNSWTRRTTTLRSRRSPAIGARRSDAPLGPCESDALRSPGVASGASEESIKKNYFRLVKEFHPDRFFGQELGSYGEKLEQIFGRVTQAFEELTDPARRKAYDRSLRKKPQRTRRKPPGRGTPQKPRPKKKDPS